MSTVKANPMVDWIRAEELYRRGEVSVREIARLEGVTEGAVRKRAKAQGWSREHGAHGLDAEIEAAVVAIRSIPIRGVQVHEKVYWAYARAAVKAARRASREAFQRRAQLNNKPNTAPETEVSEKEVSENELITEGPHPADS